MWNKSAEAKPSSQASETSVPVIPAPAANSQQSLNAPPASPTPQTSAQVNPIIIPSSNSVTTIAAGLKISGEISGTTDLYIDGETQGKVRLPNARVTVGPNGRVQADIEAREIIIEGTVLGNLKAGERLHLGAASRVQGSFLTPRFAIEDGARLRGKVEMVRASGSQSESSVGTGAEAGKAKAMSASGKDE
ncbi:MAG: polymer-forming cytoskeletal protein [Candidatus Acidiferrales bacterium]